MKKLIVTLPWEEVDEEELLIRRIENSLSKDLLLNTPDYFDFEERKINKEAIGKLSYSHLENAYRYWHNKRERYVAKSVNQESILILSVLVASLKRELDRREKDIPEI